jgi:Ca2+-binding EF-hand superfamily protein
LKVKTAQHLYQMLNLVRNSHELSKFFAQYDDNKDGVLQRGDFFKMIKGLCVGMNDLEAQAIFEEFTPPITVPSLY